MRKETTSFFLLLLRRLVVVRHKSEASTSMIGFLGAHARPTPARKMEGHYIIVPCSPTGVRGYFPARNGRVQTRRR
ncbi:hypothetical protein DM02DRAFT_609933, partial [Periconia macrospinosa]